MKNQKKRNECEEARTSPLLGNSLQQALDTFKEPLQLHIVLNLRLRRPSISGQVNRRRISDLLHAHLRGRQLSQAAQETTSQVGSSCQRAHGDAVMTVIVMVFFIKDALRNFGREMVPRRHNEVVAVFPGLFRIVIF